MFTKPEMINELKRLDAKIIEQADELTRLRAELSHQFSDMLAQGRKLAKLADENEALRVDAGRWRAFEKLISRQMSPAQSTYRLKEICPTTGDERGVSNIRQVVDAMKDTP